MSREPDRYQPLTERESVQLVWDSYANPREWFYIRDVPRPGSILRYSATTV